MGAEPSPDRECCERSQRQSHRRIEEPDRLPEQVTAENPRQLARDRGNDDLKRLKSDEDDGRQNAPFSKRLLEEALVHIETHEELVRGCVSPDEPTAIANDRAGDRA